MKDRGIEILSRILLVLIILAVLWINYEFTLTVGG